MDMPHILVGPEEKPKPSPVKEVYDNFRRKTFKYLLIITVLVVLFFIALIAGFTLTNRQTFQNRQPTTTTPTKALTDDISDWKTYKSSLLSFKYPPNWTAGMTSINNNVAIYGPSNEESLEEMITSEKSDENIKVGEVQKTTIDDKTAYARKIVRTSPSYEALYETKLIIPNIKYFDDGKWIDNGILRFNIYITDYVDSDEKKAEGLTNTIISTIHLVDIDQQEDVVSLQINNLQFELPKTSWYEYGINPTFNSEWFDIDPVSMKRHTEHFTLHYDPKKMDLEDEVLRLRRGTTNIILKEESIEISNNQGVLITSKIPSGPCYNCRWGAGSKLKEAIIVTQDGTYSFYGDVTEYETEFTQILSTFKFLD